MTKLRWGPRFNGGSVEYARGPGMVEEIGRVSFFPARKRKPPPKFLKQKIVDKQERSVQHREGMGIEPSLPTFSFDEPDPRRRALLTAQAAFQGGRALGIALEQGGSALVVVAQGRKQHNVWVNVESGKIEEIEP